MPTIEQVKKYYPNDDPVHGFDHVLRVYAQAIQIARVEGADDEIVRAATLLHDAQNMEAFHSDEGRRQNHHLSSADLAVKILLAEGWTPPRIAEVQHCILTHRFRDESNAPETIEAKVVFDADKLDAIGAIGAVRAIGYALQAGMPVYARPSKHFLETGQKEPGELHSAYHEYIFKLVKIINRLCTQTGRSLALDRQLAMVAFFESLAEEMEAVLEVD